MMYVDMYPLIIIVRMYVIYAVTFQGLYFVHDNLEWIFIIYLEELISR